MIILDGRKLAEKLLEDIRKEAAEFGKKPRLAAVVVGDDPVVRKFVAQKKKAAESAGIEVRVYEFESAITTNDLRRRLVEIVHEKKNDGVIIQLPLPSQVNTQYILNAVTPEKDVDVLSARSLGNFVVGKSPVMPPVAGAIIAIFEEYGILYAGRRIVIAGAGALVGRPVALWLLNAGATLSIIRSSTPSPEEFLRAADIIISGMGKPRFITGDMLKEGVIIIDAGTSESEGKIAGDIDFESATPKASYITPVPGGVGPVTVVMLLKNVVILARARS